MILLQKLQAHSQVYVNGKLLNLEKAPGRQVFAVLLSKRGAESEMKCLLLRLKSLSARGASRHPAFMGSCPTLSHRCVNFIILVDEFFFIFSVLVSLKDMRTRRGSVIYCVWSTFR